ncbi:MAG: hypothetical protein IJ723_01640 [Ruminococcus sp.]|nr:hypothetical protein [Ruminococcus sp.]
MGYIMKEENGEPEDLASVIDKLMADGSGHLHVDLSNMENGITFTTVNSNDCGTLGACAQPTELLDEEDDED